METLEILADKFNPATAPAEAGGMDMAEDTAYLTEQLQIVKSACEGYDEKTAYAAFDRLNGKRWKPETAKTLESIRDMLFYSSDFEGAAERANALLTQVENNDI
jgi:hypothetical protein